MTIRRLIFDFSAGAGGRHARRHLHAGAKYSTVQETIDAGVAAYREHDVRFARCTACLVFDSTLLAVDTSALRGPMLIADDDNGVDSSVSYRWHYAYLPPEDLPAIQLLQEWLDTDDTDELVDPAKYAPLKALPTVLARVQGYAFSFSSV